MLKDRLFDLLIGGLAGFVLAAGLSTLCYDKQVRELQDFTHRVKTSTAAITARARADAHAQRHRADSIEDARQPVIIQAQIQTASAEQLELSLADQKSTADSNVVLRAQVRALKTANVNLWMALQQSNQIIALERGRGDSLDKALGEVNVQLQGLAARVEQLKPRPKLLRIAWRTVEAVAIAKLSYDCGKRRCL